MQVNECFQQLKYNIGSVFFLNFVSIFQTIFQELSNAVFMGYIIIIGVHIELYTETEARMRYSLFIIILNRMF